MVGRSKSEKIKPLLFDTSELVRGWRILRQQLDLAVDPETQRLWGRVTIAVAALSTQCTSINLHLRRCVVLAITVNGQPASHVLNDPLNNSDVLKSISDSTCPRVDEVQAAQCQLSLESNPEELQIFVPPAVSADIVDALAAMDSTNAVAAAAAVAGSVPLPPPSCSMNDLPKVTVVIEYRALDRTGSVAYHADPAYAIISGRNSLARCWMPCVDTQNWCDRCLWKIVVSVPASHTVVCSGDLIETRLLVDPDTAPDDNIWSSNPLRASFASSDRQHAGRLDGPRKRFTYVVDLVTSASEIAFVVGPFIPLADPATPTCVTHFCLPGRGADLVHTSLSVFSQARSFCNDYFNMQLPYSSVKQVFVGNEDNCDVPRCFAGGLILYPEHLLHNDRCIDEGFESRKAICSALVSCYIGGLIRPRGAEDAWFVAGLSSHVSALATASMFGKNWYRVSLMDEVQAMAREERAKSPVLAHVAKNPLFSMDKVTPSIRRRAHIIAYIIERRVGFDILRRAVRDVLAETFRAYDGGSSNDESIMGLRVAPFLKRIRAICGTDVRNLVRAWAASSGTPRIRFGYKYDSRRHQVEFAVEQKGVNGERLDEGREGLLFQGSLGVRVMEPEGTFDHTVAVIDPWFVTELPCHSRRTKQKMVLPIEKDVGDETSRATPISWVRIDPEMDCCIDSTFIQSDFAWAALLAGERDAVAQCTACRALADYGTPVAAKALAEALGNKEHYWRVRADAASGLSVCENGLSKLMEFYIDSYSEKVTSPVCTENTGAEGENEVAFVSNDFSDFAEYMVRRAVVRAIAASYAKCSYNREGALTVPEFFSTLLAENDNSKNAFDDDHYVADLLRAAKEVVLVSLDDRKVEAEQVLEQIRRYCIVDRLAPSKSGAVAVALIQSLSEIEAVRIKSLKAKPVYEKQGGLDTSNDPSSDLYKLISEQFKYSTPFPAQMAAVSSLILLHGWDPNVTLWLLSRADYSDAASNVAGISSRNSRELNFSRFESSSVRRGILETLRMYCGAFGLQKGVPLVTVLRRRTAEAKKVCRQLLTLAIGDCDERLRVLAIQVALLIWGRGKPVCFPVEHKFGTSADTQNHKVERVLGPTSPSQKRRWNGLSPKITVRRDQSRVPVSEHHPKSDLPGFVANGSHPSDLAATPCTTKSLELNETAEPRSEERKRPGVAGLLKPIVVPGRSLKLGVPMTEKSFATEHAANGSDLTMLEEDMQYLKKAWREYRRNTKVDPKGRQFSPGGLNSHLFLNGKDECPSDRADILACTDQMLMSSAVSPGGLYFGDNVSLGDESHGHTVGSNLLSVGSDEERQHRKEKRRKKKKRKRHREDGDERGDEDGNSHERRKKKKRRSKDREGLMNHDGTMEFSVSRSLPVASSEGSIRSGGDGKLGVIKIKLGGAQMTSPFPPSV